MIDEHPAHRLGGGREQVATIRGARQGGTVKHPDQSLVNQIGRLHPMARPLLAEQLTGSALELAIDGPDQPVARLLRPGTGLFDQERDLSRSHVVHSVSSRQKLTLARWPIGPRHREDRPWSLSRCFRVRNSATELRRVLCRPTIRHGQTTRFLAGGTEAGRMSELGQQHRGRKQACSTPVGSRRSIPVRAWTPRPD